VTVTDWWHQLSSSALLGTSRKPPPALSAALGVTGRPESGPEVALLDGAALGGAVLRAARGSRTAPQPGRAAPADDRPLAPPGAVQLLDLLLSQPPVPAPLVPLALGTWLDEADARGVRIPHRHLPGLLTIGSRREVFRKVARRVGGARLTWLAEQNPEWSWFLKAPTKRAGSPAPELPERDDWRRLPVAERRDLLAALDRPDTGLPLAFLEMALDDRSEPVRHAAQQLLDGAPTSDRALRLAARLRPLLRASGVVRKSLEIDLPTEPDAAGVRDGLGKARHGSQRAHWLEQIAAGAPLDVWTEATGRSPEQTVAMIREPAALRGILRAVRARRDPTWARALLHDHPDLYALLPSEDQAVEALRIVRDDARPDAVLTVIRHLPPPWGREVSEAVVARLRRRKQPLPEDIYLLTPLAAGLDPAVVPAVREWEQSEHPWGDLPTDLARYLSLIPAITEAFR
jgi:hypothetical protein